MHKIRYETKLGRIVLNCENPCEEMVSFDGCFDMIYIRNDSKYDSAIRLPKIFKTRGSKVFSTRKIADPKNIAHSIELIGKVEYTDLKRHIPSIFDIKFINKINSEKYLRENLDLLVEIASEIISREEVLSILKP